MKRNPKTGALEPFDFEQLLQNVPELKQFDIQIDAYQFDPPIDSSDMSPARWTDLSHCIADRYDDYDGFVVLHGTDTMAYTASALSYMLENLTKPVVFTGSQLPIGQLRTDGKENLITAVEIAAAKDDEGHALTAVVGQLAALQAMDRDAPAALGRQGQGRRQERQHRQAHEDSADHWKLLLPKSSPP